MAADILAAKSPAEYMKAARALKDDASLRAKLTPLRLVVLASFTTTRFSISSGDSPP